MLVKLLNNTYVNLTLDNIEYISEPSIDSYHNRFRFNIRTHQNEYTVEQLFRVVLNNNQDYSYNNNKEPLDKHFEKFKIYHKNLIDFINTKDIKYLKDNEKIFKTIDLKK